MFCLQVGVITCFFHVRFWWCNKLWMTSPFLICFLLFTVVLTPSWNHLDDPYLSMLERHPVDPLWISLIRTGCSVCKVTSRKWGPLDRWSLYTFVHGPTHMSQRTTTLLNHRQVQEADGTWKIFIFAPFTNDALWRVVNLVDLLRYVSGSFVSYFSVSI